MKKPNIILIVLDGLRADRLGCYGHTRDTSPAIDAIAARSTICLNNYTVGIASTQSHVSMFTGVHPQFHRAAENLSYFDGCVPTIQQIVRRHGYHVFGTSSLNSYLSPKSGVVRGFDRYVAIAKSTARTANSGIIAKMTKAILGKARSGEEVFRAAWRFAGLDLNRYLERFYLTNDSTGQMPTSPL